MQSKFCNIKMRLWIGKCLIIIFLLFSYLLIIGFKILNWTKKDFFHAILQYFLIFSHSCWYTRLSDTACNPLMQKCIWFVFLLFQLPLWHVKTLFLVYFFFFNCFKHQEPHKNNPLTEKEIKKKSYLHRLELDELGELSVTVVLRR